MEARDTYLSLMLTIRERFDAIEGLRRAGTPTFARAEAAAFNGRKIIEAISFACLVAVQNGLREVPRGARGQWNAETILNNLKSKGLSVLPSPSHIRQALPEEQRDNDVAVVIDGIPERRLTYEEITRIYRALHAWLHEVNPYVHIDHVTFMTAKLEPLWSDLASLKLFVERHFIAIRGEALFCVLWDSHDGQTKVSSLRKAAA
jgi:hypothetical protein